MKRTWFWIPAAILLAAVVVLVLRLMVFLPQGDPEEQNSVPTTTTTTTSTTGPTESTDKAASDALSFKGKVMEVVGEEVLMECRDKNKFDTVWVNVAVSGVAPLVGQEYTVYYDDVMMPSMPPRITAVRMELIYSEALTE